MWRHRALLVVLTSFNLLCFVLSPAHAVERLAWIPAGEKQPSAFLLQPHGFWIEKSTAGHQFQFEEEERTDDYVVLHEMGHALGLPHDLARELQLSFRATVWS